MADFATNYGGFFRQLQRIFFSREWRIFSSAIADFSTHCGPFSDKKLFFRTNRIIISLIKTKEKIDSLSDVKFNQHDCPKYTVLRF
jgi:hypothetical protein